MTVVPELDRRMVDGLLRAHLPGAKDRRLLLVHGRYSVTGPTEFSLVTREGERRAVRVTHATSVLGIVDAWQAHRAADGADLLVVTTDVADDRLGLDLLGETVRSQTITVDKADVVRQLFSAADLDPRMYREAWQWLLDALIAAAPADGWPRRGGVLTLDAAVRALVGVRLGPAVGADGSAPVDLDALLTWSRTTGGPERFAALDPAERTGIADWLRETAGEAAPLLLRLVETGRGPDATALGVLASVMSDEAATPESAVALGSLFGGVGLNPAELRAYTRAVEGVLTRWIGEAAGAGAAAEQARNRVLQVVERADELAASAHLRDALAGNPFLPSGFRARLHRLARALSDGPGAAQEALNHVREHRLAAHFFADRVALAEMAVRLTRWLATDEPDVEAVGQAVEAHAADWGWADRALDRLWVGDAEGDVVVDQAYRAVHDAARARRARIDEAFAGVLEPWARHACQANPAGALLIEDVLRTVAVPLANHRPATRSGEPQKAARPPLVLVLDGMSNAVAAQLADELTATGRWTELSLLSDRRAAAVAMIPTVTTISRFSLLTGRPGSGGQNAEREGFAAFWRQHRQSRQQHPDGGDEPGVLFHKADIPGPAGHRLAPALVAAIAGDAVVGVVLNTIDDSLADGRQGLRADWTADAVTHFTELVNAARAQGRPVVLVSDHGHVLDRTAPNTGPTPAEGVQSARWRTGTPAGGELALTGPRVLEGGGNIVAAWREEIRYTPRKAGHHGGAALAEMAIPVVVLTPTPDVVPPGWAVLPRESSRPAWWEPAVVPAAGNAVPAAEAIAEKTGKNGRTGKSGRARPKPEPAPGTALFELGQVEPVRSDRERPTPAAAQTLGQQVVATKVYETQGAFVRIAPDRKVVAAVIDRLAEAGGTLSLAAVTAAVTASGGRARSRPEGLVTVLARLLNVEGYDVISLVDGRSRVRLNVERLREQFELPAA